MKNIVVFSPTYNEIDNIEIFIRQVFDVLPNCKLIIVDDNSPDGTSQKVKELQSIYRNLYLITRTGKRGRGYAGIEGFKKALELQADIIIEMDADLSHSPYEIPKLLKIFEENPKVDIVVGSRYVFGGKDEERNIIRKIVTLFARVYINFFLGIFLRDPTSGFRLYRRDVIEKILPYLSASDPFIVTEVNYISKMFGFTFYEVPIEFHKRIYGKSKLSLIKLFKYLFKVVILPISFFIKNKYNLLFIKFLFLTSLFRIFLVGLFGLTDDEAHYWQYSQHIDFSFYDHPPLVGYLIYVFTHLLGNNLYGVRFSAIICFLVSSIYFYKLTKEIFDEKVAFYTYLLFSFVPVVFVGSIIMLPDAPLGVFWMMYIFYFYKFMITNNTIFLYLSAIAGGFALLSKYNAIFLFVSSFIIFIIKKELRNYIFKKDFYYSYILSLLIFSPVIFWNIAHNFASFTYQLSRANFSTKTFNFKIFGENLLFQSIYISPVVFLTIIFCVIYFLVRKEDFRYKFLIYFCLPGVIFFNLVGLKSRILPHWPSIFYISCLPLIFLIDKKKISYYLCLISSFLISLFIVLVVLFGVIKLPENLADKDTPDKLYGWDIAAKEAYSLVNLYNIDFILTHKYYVAGQIRFALAKYYKNSKIVEVFCLDDYLNQYDFWNKNLVKFDKKNALFITEGRFKEEVFLKEIPFSNIKALSVVSFRKNKFWPPRVFKFYLCEKFSYNEIPQKFFQQHYNNSLKVTEYFKNYDKEIFLKINSMSLYKSKIFTFCAYMLTSLGSGFVLIPLVALVLYLLDKKSFIKNLITFLIIASLGGLIIQILKNLFDKPRPLKLFLDILSQPINVIGEQLREYGFPSGHTFLAFSTYVFLSDRIKRKFVSLFLFIIALMVGISRVIVGAHFLSDVIGGMIIGILFTNICIKIEKELT
ncbi:MAG: glycosyltransferase family 39 protein [Endomicrobia bacterium]|nr:glycosyltransferase family 39 protein [Endomicrobiia bacterium]